MLLFVPCDSALSHLGCPGFEQQLRMCLVKSFWCLAGVVQCCEHTSYGTITAPQALHGT